MSIERDHSAVPTSQLASIYDEYVTESHDDFAARVGYDRRSLQQIVRDQKYPSYGLRIASMIIEDGLGLSINSLVGEGRLTIVPGDKAGDAAKMVTDQVWAEVVSEIDAPFGAAGDAIVDAAVRTRLAEIGEAEIEARIARLKALRSELCVKNSDQAERMARENQRNVERVTRQRDERRVLKQRSA